jgi:hypothetical protein
MPILTILPSGETKWRAIWRDADGKQFTKTCATERAARAHEVTKKLELNGHECELDGCHEMIIRRGQKFCSKEHKAKFNNAKRERVRPHAELRPPTECKLDGCGNMVKQKATGRPGEFCCREHGAAYWNNVVSVSKGPNTRHRITGIDENTRMGVCSTCGPVRAWEFNDRYADGGPRRRWRCPNRVRAARPQWQNTRGEWLRKTCVRYSTTEAELDGMILAQEGRCAICEREMPRPHVDHDHETNRIRGLLCVTCNTAIGKLDDDADRLRSAAAYLERTTA